LKDEHELTKPKDQLGILPTYITKNRSQMDQYLLLKEVVLSLEEALIQFFVVTNQPFTLVENKAF
jgi:hypothetical protein